VARGGRRGAVAGYGDEIARLQLVGGSGGRAIIGLGVRLALTGRTD
jgi:hypothetical protein